MSEMIERVTRAIGSNMQSDDDCAYSPHHPVPCHLFTCKCARAAKEALQSMREPTEAMTLKGNHSVIVDSWGEDPNAAACWRTMIDAALSDKST
jgi:hypothetical protein